MFVPDPLPVIATATGVSCVYMHHGTAKLHSLQQCDTMLCAGDNATRWHTLWWYESHCYCCDDDSTACLCCFSAAAACNLPTVGDLVTPGSSLGDCTKDDSHATGPPYISGTICSVNCPVDTGTLSKLTCTESVGGAGVWSPPVECLRKLHERLSV